MGGAAGKEPAAPRLLRGRGQDMTETLGRGRLTERAYHYLRDGIMRGELPPGSILAEEEIATTLGTSRTPVRQALGLLLQEGFIEVGPRRQVVVRGFTPEHKAEILMLREALEGVAVRRACEVMQLEDIDYLHLLLLRMRRAAENGRGRLSRSGRGVPSQDRRGR